MSIQGPKGAQLTDRFVPKSRQPERYTDPRKRALRWSGLAMWLFGWLLAWPLSAVGFVLMLAGMIRAKGWRCSVCANPIDSGQVRICPHCRADYR